MKTRDESVNVSRRRKKQQKARSLLSSCSL
jgi:hypothetical protein